MRYRNVGDVHRPDMIRPNARQVAEKIGVNFGPGGLILYVRLAIQRSDPRTFHQRCNVQSTNFEALLHEQTPQYSATCEGQLHVQLVDPVRQLTSAVEIGSG